MALQLNLELTWANLDNLMLETSLWVYIVIEYLIGGYILSLYYFGKSTPAKVNQVMPGQGELLRSPEVVWGYGYKLRPTRSVIAIQASQSCFWSKYMFMYNLYACIALYNESLSTSWMYIILNLVFVFCKVNV